MRTPLIFAVTNGLWCPDFVCQVNRNAGADSEHLPVGRGGPTALPPTQIANPPPAQPNPREPDSAGYNLPSREGSRRVGADAQRNPGASEFSTLWPQTFSIPQSLSPAPARLEMKPKRADDPASATRGGPTNRRVDGGTQWIPTVAGQCPAGKTGLHRAAGCTGSERKPPRPAEPQTERRGRLLCGAVAARWGHRALPEFTRPSSVPLVGRAGLARRQSRPTAPGARHSARIARRVA